MHKISFKIGQLLIVLSLIAPAVAIVNPVPRTVMAQDQISVKKAKHLIVKHFRSHQNKIKPQTLKYKGMQHHQMRFTFPRGANDRITFYVMDTGHNVRIRLDIKAAKGTNGDFTMHEANAKYYHQQGFNKSHRIVTFNL